MATPNYRQAKRHKELARKARQEQKLRRRTARETSMPADAEPDTTPVPEVGTPPASESDA